MNKEDFPIFKANKDLIYLDSAASAQKPLFVLDFMHNFAATRYSNVHRGNYYLSEMATKAYEDARHTIAQFVGAKDEDKPMYVSLIEKFENSECLFFDELR